MTLEKILILGPDTIIGRIEKREPGWVHIKDISGKNRLLPDWYVQRTEALPPVTLD